MEKLYTPKEVGESLGLHTNTVRYLCRTGEIEHKRLGYWAIRISESAVKKYLKKNEVKSQRPGYPGRRTNDLS